MDPGIVARVIASIPGRAFKSGGLRTAMLARLKNIERATAEGHIDAAVQELNNLRRHMDGCPPKADRRAVSFFYLS